MVTGLKSIVGSARFAGKPESSTTGAARDSERICYVHVGTHKTGTTSIQAFLAANRDRFAAGGVFFPSAGSDNDPGVISHHQLALQLLGNPAFEEGRGGLAEVANELRATNARTACLSSEDFTFLHASPPALTRLRDAIRAAGFTPRIVVYLRAQASYCTAVYAENVRHGYRAAFDAYLHDVIERGCYVWDGGSGPPFDYARLLDGFAAVFGRDAIVARPYRSGARDNELLFSFARLLLPDQTSFATYSVPAVRLNGSLSFGDVLTLLGVPNDATEKVRFTPLDLARLWRLLGRFAASNRALARRYGVVVPVFERVDLALAFPLRKTRAKTRSLARFRRLLAKGGPTND